MDLLLTEIGHDTFNPKRVVFSVSLIGCLAAIAMMLTADFQDWSAEAQGRTNQIAAASRQIDE